MTTFQLSKQVVNNDMNFARSDVVCDHLRD